VSNPILNDSNFEKAANSPGWAAPDAATRATPIDDGPTSPWIAAGDRMTVGGTLTATAVLFVILLFSAVFGWQAVDQTNPQLPGLALAGIAVGFGCVIAMMFKPMLAKIVAPIYALAQGFVVGAVSAFYESQWNGIVIQAVGATLGVFLVMLFLYRTRIIKVTNKFRRVIIAATLGLMVFYLFSFVLSLFGTDIGIFSSSSFFGIAFSVFAAGLAAFNLMLDFDFIERGAEQGLPKGMEWVGAFGLLVTIVWLYLEMLRLLAKLQNR
jgi:uncharacterized YccA/Bax inhibitor family protein